MCVEEIILVKFWTYWTASYSKSVTDVFHCHMCTGVFGKPNILSTGTRHWIWSSIESRDTELYSWIPQVMLLTSFVFKVCRFLQDYGFAGWGGLLDRGLFSGAWENIIPTFSPSNFFGNSTVQLSRMRQWAFHAWQVRARFRILSYEFMCGRGTWLC